MNVVVKSNSTKKGMDGEEEPEPKRLKQMMQPPPSDIWSHVLLFSSVKDVPAVSCVSKEWNATLKLIEQEHWAFLFAKLCPRLAEIVKNYYESDTSIKQQWKLMCKIRIASPYQASPPNKDLQKDLETIFSPLGILAFSNCCTNCTGSYADGGDRSFDGRSRALFGIRSHLGWSDSMLPDNGSAPDQQDGISFFKLFTSGMNYHETVSMVPVCYKSLECLDKHWESERKLLDLYCAVLGLNHEDYTIEKPESENMCVMIKFKEPLTLEEERYDEEEDDEEEEEESEDESEEDEDEPHAEDEVHSRDDWWNEDEDDEEEEEESEDESEEEDENED